MSTHMTVASALMAMVSLGASATAAPVVTNGGFETLQNGLPVDWNAVVGHRDNRYETSTDAHTGQRSLRLLRVTDKGEVGFNRTWGPNSGQQGKMLGQRKGGLAFWYKVVRLNDKADMQFMAIPMSDRPLEETNAQRSVYTVPRAHVGDGEWHRAILKYDYSAATKVKWVHVSGRLNTGTGEVLVDDVAYLPKVGPLVEVTGVELATVGKAGDERFTVSCLVSNRGDEPTGPISVGLSVPKACQVTSPPQAGAAEALGVDQKRSLAWTVRGRRAAGDKVTIRIDGASVSVREAIVLQPKLEVWLAPAQSILLGDRPTKLSARIANTGTAAARDVRRIVMLSPAGTLKLEGPVAPWETLPVLLPGTAAVPSWTLAPLRPHREAKVTMSVLSSDAGAVTHHQTFVCLGGMGKARCDDVRWRARGVELVFHGSTLGHGALSVYADPPDGKGGRRLVGRIPRAGRVLVANAPGQPADDVVDFFGQLTTTAEQARIVARQTDRDGAKWTLTVRFTPGPAAGLVRVDYEVQCDRDRQVRAFEGPMLWAGEGAFGGKKRDAVVPGIEWLIREEISSSDLDFAPNHGHRTRYVPHPNELTWPIMAVAHDGVGVGLMWDPHQRFDGQRRGPQPVFASPDHFDHRNHHLMGLMLPTVREMKQRNVRRAPEPVAIQAGQKWTLSADLWVNGTARDSLTALDTWMDVHDLPAPMPPPRGDWAKEVTFSMTAYIETMYDPNADGWISSVGGPGALQGPPGPHAHFGLDVWMGSHLADDAGVRQRCRAMFDRMFARRNRPVSGNDVGYIMDRPDRALTSRALGVSRLIHAQGPQGEWRFDADHKDERVFKGFDYHELGPDNAVEVGTCAQKAYQILLLARLTGDRPAYEAGLRTLAFMKRFEVPRAAQVWEVPVHSPDILAAADAIDAYLEAYQIDGNKDHLTEAVRWARAGLPFVYVWDTPEFPWMRYGSIPVFGASWMKWSWIANLVQWNGLRYAYALIKLARYDDSRPWRRIATGLTTSAMYQQHPDGKLKALWPDSIRVDGPGRSGWEFAPRLILKNVYALTGRDEVPTTKRVDGFVLSAVGTFRQVTSTDGGLQVKLELPEPLRGWLVVAGTSKPTAVRLGGPSKSQQLTPLPPDTAVLSQAGYLYRPALRLLMIALPTSGTHDITIGGVKPRPGRLMPEIREAINFEFNRDPEGWQATHDVTDLTVKDGRLIVRTTGPDPYLTRPALRVPTASVKTITIRMQVDRGANAQLFWTTNASPQPDEAKSLHFRLHPGQMHDYRLPVSTHKAWTGQHITSIRIDPTDQAGARVGIEWVRGE